METYEFNNLTFEPGKIKEACVSCGNPYTIIHHIFPGRGRRNKSDDYGLMVSLCARCHNEVHIHPNNGLDLQLKQAAQKYFEEHYGNRDKFRKVFGMSYL